MNILKAIDELFGKIEYRLRDYQVWVQDFTNPHDLEGRTHYSLRMITHIPQHKVDSTETGAYVKTGPCKITVQLVVDQNVVGALDMISSRFEDTEEFNLRLDQLKQQFIFSLLYAGVQRNCEVHKLYFKDTYR